jgi:molecular chaperone DnaK (HSP70)
MEATMSATPIGIDLGTTYSAVAVVNENGEVQLLPNPDKPEPKRVGLSGPNRLK